MVLPSRPTASAPGAFATLIGLPADRAAVKTGVTVFEPHLVTYATAGPAGPRACAAEDPGPAARRTQRTDQHHAADLHAGLAISACSTVGRTCCSRVAATEPTTRPQRST